MKVTLKYIPTRKGNSVGWDDVEGNFFEYWKVVEEVENQSDFGSISWEGDKFPEEFVLFLSKHFRQHKYNRLVFNYSISLGFSQELPQKTYFYEETDRELDSAFDEDPSAYDLDDDGNLKKLKKLNKQKMTDTHVCSKKEVNPYILYTRSVLPSLKDANPHLSSQELIHLVAKMWKEVGKYEQADKVTDK